jgi:hypothetical protein
MWFRGDVPAAEREIQHILSNAKRDAMIVDPYFTAAQVPVWLPSVVRQGVAIRVLTSKAGLRQQSIDGLSLKGSDLEAEHLNRLNSGLQAAQTQRLVNPTTVRVMRGKLPVVHDRFIVVDDQVWLLGASLNEFGTRGTMLVELPIPREVSSELEKVWADESVSLPDRLVELARGDDP